jgi:predicted ATPase/transcriptional regulator with XRE-family HTH domain
VAIVVAVPAARPDAKADWPAATQPSLAELLREHRTRSGMTQEELAAAAEISTRSVSDLERGITRTARRDTVARLVAALGLTADAAELFAAVARRRTSRSGPTQAGPSPKRFADGAPARDEPGHSHGGHEEALGSRLPVASTSLVGREDVIDDIVGMLVRDDVRVLTVTGPAGVGKTRVVLEAAARWSRCSNRDRIIWVPLAHLRDTELVMPAVANALGVRAAGGADLWDVLVEHLSAQPAVLVLDNLEQLIEVTNQLAQLVAASARLRILASSRVALRMQAEHEIRLDPLPVPTTAEPTAAVQLFLQRAVAIAPSWQPTPDDVAAVAELCRIVDGLPLAIELAAAWMRVLRPTELLARERAPLELLARGPRDAPERHRSLRAALAWSIDLLGVDAVRLLRRVAVWPGGWSLDQAERVCAIDDIDIVGATAELVEANLVRATFAAPRPTRYSMLAVLREFAAELLVAAGEREEIEGRHTAEMLHCVEQCTTKLTGPEQLGAIAELDAEYRNIQGALERGVRARDAETALRLAGRLWGFWEVRGLGSEGRRWLDRALALPGGPALTRAVALNAAGNLARDQVDAPAARAFYTEALELFRAEGDVARAAGAENNLANVALDEGDLPTAERRYRRALETVVAVGDRYRTALFSNNLALTLRRTAVAEPEVIQLLERSIAGFTELGDQRGRARALESMARVMDARSEHASALRLHAESLQLRCNAGDDNGRIYSIEGMARSLAALGSAHRAAQLLGHAQALRERHGDPRTDDDETEVGPARNSIVAAIGADGLERETARGAELPLDRILAAGEQR